ncbi:MAG: S8 family serine peptidase [Syntrophomonadaceae bacterium]|jgi:serine protease AprX|nr:S8 family serine peptidase [Bacillota bacterium]NLP24006.1 S8 family serine peptidase [Syntrophomonadaceae bacterium]
MKKILSILLLGTFVFFIVYPVYADDKQVMTIVDAGNCQVIQGQMKEATKNIIVINNEPKASIVPIQEDKIDPELRLAMETASPDDKINIEVGLDYNVPITVNDFIANYKELAESIEAEKFTTFQFYANANCEQICNLAQLKEVNWVILPSKSKIILLPEPQLPSQDLRNENAPNDNDIGIKLNAATDMTGAKKARQDYNVTGNMDGNETIYSRNDVVIAIMDSGIDTGHVDLDDGKVIGWVDLIGDSPTPIDELGHGTAVASVAAGTGEGDPGIQVSFAPGAALVGIRVMRDEWTSGDVGTVIDGINWAINNRNNLGIDILNISIGFYNMTTSDLNRLNTAITNAYNAGILVFVAAGNDGPEYETLAQSATCTNVKSVGAMVDPYEGGWYPARFSSRGSALGQIKTGPFFMAPGAYIRCAEANTRSGYITGNGTSYATPAISGITALMIDALGGSGRLYWVTEDFGKNGFDPVYGYGEILAYDSIKATGGYSYGSFDDNRDHWIDSRTIQEGQWILYLAEINEVDPNLYFATTLIMTDEDFDDFDLYIWNPGKDPYSDPADHYSVSSTPQETISFKPTITGVYTIGVHSYSGTGNYTIDFVGRFL